MSMWLDLARVSAATFERIREEPSLIEAIFFGDDEDAEKTLAELGIGQGDIAGFDYRSAYEARRAMAEAMGDELDEDGDPVLDDLGVGGELDFDAGYGPAFYVEPSATGQATDSIACAIDDDAKAVIEAAAAGGDYLIGVIS